jgi:putative toxin-antitoxin system antitoxin component (TIGR02293 family)
VDKNIARKRVTVASTARSKSCGSDAIAEVDKQRYAMTSRYLGGKKFWPPKLSSQLDVHNAIMSGVPYASVIFLVSQVKGLEEGDVAKVLGVSTRTLRRLSETPEKPMPANLATKVWLFAETLAKAADTFGGKEEAEGWMDRPAMGLNGHRPIELLRTLHGAELVNEFLTRLEYGVYT